MMTRKFSDCKSNVRLSHAMCHHMALQPSYTMTNLHVIPNLYIFKTKFRPVSPCLVSAAGSDSNSYLLCETSKTLEHFKLVIFQYMALD